MLTNKPKTKTSVTRKNAEQWFYRIEEHYLETFKPTFGNRFSTLFFYVFQFFMLFVFWYTTVYVYSHPQLAGKNTLVFFAIYMTVGFCAFYQTIKAITLILTDIKGYLQYKELALAHKKRKKPRNRKKDSLSL